VRRGRRGREASGEREDEIRQGTRGEGSGREPRGHRRHRSPGHLGDRSEWCKSVWFLDTDTLWRAGDMTSGQWGRGDRDWAIMWGVWVGVGFEKYRAAKVQHSKPPRAPSASATCDKKTLGFFREAPRGWFLIPRPKWQHTHLSRRGLSARSAESRRRLRRSAPMSPVRAEATALEAIAAAIDRLCDSNRCAPPPRPTSGCSAGWRRDAPSAPPQQFVIKGKRASAGTLTPPRRFAETFARPRPRRSTRWRRRS
jgi:hypothetical protein